VGKLFLPKGLVEVFNLKVAWNKANAVVISTLVKKC